MIEVRVSRDGEYVLCGRALPNGQRCPERLGYVVRETGQETRIRPLPGFVFEHDVWRLGKRAAERWQRDRAAAAAGDTDAQQRLRLGIAARGRRLPWDIGIGPMHPRHLKRGLVIAPAAMAWDVDETAYQPHLSDGDRVLCPRCAGLNVVNAARMLTSGG